MAHALTRDAAPAASNFNWNAAIGAGLLAGVVFQIVEMLLGGWAHGYETDMPSRWLAAVVMGGDVLEGRGFDATVFCVASLIHYARSLIFGCLIAWAVETLRLQHALLFAALLAEALFLLGYYLLSPRFPWLGSARHWDSLLDFALFGALAAGYYRYYRRHANPHGF